MGEATYYLKAEFKSKKEAEKVFKKFEPLINDLIKLNDKWQEIRGSSGVGCSLERLKKFPSWIFVNKFDASVRDNYLNFLAGELPDMNSGFFLEQEESTIKLSCCVWHFTQWEGIVKWLEAQGALKAAYISDEYVSDFIWNAI